jgi:HEAT repeat protein
MVLAVTYGKHQAALPQPDAVQKLHSQGLSSPVSCEYHRWISLQELTMPDNRLQRGVRMPGVWQVCVLAAALAAGWILWSEFQRRIRPPAVDSEPDAGARLRVTLNLSKEGKPGLNQLNTLLDTDDPRTRDNALLGLAELGPDGHEFLPAVRRKLADQDSSVRQTALMAFSKICDDREQILAATAGFLADSEPQAREFAARNLQTAGASAVPALIAMADSPNADARLLVIRLLADADEDRDPGEVNLVLRSLLHDPDAAVRLQAVTAVVSRGAAELDEVCGWLREDDPKVVGQALAAVSSFGQDSFAVLPELQALLEDTTGTRPWPGAVLAFLKSVARPLIPVLQKRSSMGSPRSRFYLAQALAEIGADPNNIVPILTPLLAEKDDYNVCWQAGELLARVDPEEGRRQVSRLIEQLANKETSVDGKDPDLQALSGLQSLANEAVPLLMRLLSHSDWYVRSMAMSTLGGIGPDAAPAVPILMRFINRKAPSISEGFDVGPAIQALGRIGPVARPAVPRLIELINGKSHDSMLRERIVRALGQIGEASPEVISVLRQEIAATEFHSSMGRIPQDARTRVHALQSLVLLAGDSATTFSDLLSLLDDNESGLRMQAALAIGRLAGNRREAIPRLIEALADQNYYVCIAATLALGQIGADAGAALPALRELLLHKRNHVSARRIATRGGITFPSVDLQFMPDGIDLRQFSLAKAAQWAISAIETPD